MELVQLLLRLFDLQIANHQDAGLREQLEHRDRHILALEDKVAYLESHLVAMPTLQAEVARLQGRDAEATALRAALEQESALADERHQIITRLQPDLEQKNQHIVYLEQLLQKIEAGRVLRLTRSVSRLLGK
jgi:uncharacterized protein involved in exopolysaccharide biosynthesis